MINSLIDGVMSNADLTVAVSAPAASTLNSTDILEAGKVYLAAGTTATDANVLAAMNTALVAFTGRGDYVDQMANDGAIDIVGANSVTASDNLITLGAGDDIAVLGTTLGANTANSSNETIVIGTGFGNDTVVNFAVSGNGQDYFDFTALKGTTFTAIAAGYATDKSITVQTMVPSTPVTEKAAVDPGSAALLSDCRLRDRNNSRSLRIWVFQTGRTGRWKSFSDRMWNICGSVHIGECYIWA